MHQRRVVRLVASIFGAALLLATSGVASFAASPAAASLSTHRAGDDDRHDDDRQGGACTGTLTNNGNTCTVSQTNTAGNNAECNLFSSSPNVTQQCIITQTSGAGSNRVRVRMRIAQEKTAAAFPGVCPTLRSLPLSNQNGCQILTVTQTSVSGSNSLSAVLRIIQENDEGSAQRQNAGQAHTVTQNSTTGAQLANLQLFQTQDEEAEVKAQQWQRSTANGHITQNSADISRYDRKFVPHQAQQAPPGSTQIQDPDDYCCSGQAGNPADSANIVTAVRQSSTCGTITTPTCSQGDFIRGNTVPTSGKGTVHLSVATNAATTTQNCGPQQGGCTRFIFIGFSE